MSPLRMGSVRKLGAFLFLTIAVIAIVFVRQRIVADRTSFDFAAPHGAAALNNSVARDGAAPGTTPEQSLAALLDNRLPQRLLRLVAFDPATRPQLSIGHLKMLGRPGQKFTFVGDYDELRGATVADTIYRLGGSLKPGEHVSAILFPAGNRPLYPANARGLLQVIQQVEQSLVASGESPTDFAAADLAKLLSPAALAALDNHDPAAGRWENYRPFFCQYEQAVERVRAGAPTALQHIGNIDRDWHPLGYAQAMGKQSGTAPDLSVDLDGQALPVPHFGARVFLVANADLADLTGQCLIDIEDPAKQRIPELNLPDN